MSGACILRSGLSLQAVLQVLRSSLLTEIEEGKDVMRTLHEETLQYEQLTTKERNTPFKK